MRWDGRAFTRVATGKNGFLSMLWRASNGALWVAGFDGAILHREAN